ncbi:hypothetical protein [Streptomyces sp. NPDC050535]|uniref:hypothetical protein n=1 Tax=Streptomyces sp. NPDC050535 TaxID=3365626 RepID=UPI00379FA676
MPAGLDLSDDEHGDPPAHDMIKLLRARDLLMYPSNLLSRDAEKVVQTVAATLVLPQGHGWREAHEMALLGPWSDALWDTGHLPCTALGFLKAEARTVHRQLLPLWRRRTRHGRVLSLDADLGGLCLYDLVAPDADLLAHTVDGVFVDERLNKVLRALKPAERQAVFAYAEGEGTTWTEAAAAAGALDPAAFGDRVRRKVKRLAAEQRRRTEQRQHSRPPIPGT